MKSGPTEFEIWSEYITLGQLLKAIGQVQNGAEVKDYLSSEVILVNGETDDRRGRKLYPKDAVLLPDGGTVVIVKNSR